jgi:hypothetical protein
VKQAAARRLAVQKVEADVNAVLAHDGVKAVTDPFEELGRLAAEVVAFKDALSQRVNALASIRYSAPGAGTEQLRAEVALLERAQDRAGRLLNMLVTSGFEERRVRLSEQQGLLAYQVITACFRRLNLSEAQTAAAPGIAAEELRRAIAVEQGRVVP